MEYSANNRSKKIGICGSPGVGKDYVAQVLANKLPGYTVQEYSTYFRKMASEHFLSASSKVNVDMFANADDLKNFLDWCNKQWYAAHEFDNVLISLHPSIVYAGQQIDISHEHALLGLQGVIFVHANPTTILERQIHRFETTSRSLQQGTIFDILNYQNSLYKSVKAFSLMANAPIELYENNVINEQARLQNLITELNLT